MSDEIPKNIMNRINRRNNKNDDSKRKKEEKKDKGNNDATPDKSTSGNTDKTGKSFNHNGTLDEGDASKKDFDPDHSTTSGPCREQSQQAPAQKSGHNIHRSVGKRIRITTTKIITNLIALIVMNVQ